MKFQFTIGDLGTFLNKSPVTIRAWERKGLIEIPRKGGKRVMTAKEVWEIADIAYEAKRISGRRLNLIGRTVRYLQELEEE